MYRKDTIAAISTPLGEGGIGIVRISGAAAEGIARKIFTRIPSGGLQSHRFYYGELIDPDTGDVVDEILLVLMQAPRSYTCEDLLEIHCHGGYLIVQRVLQLVLRSGARLAEPGEFTKRAFLNGRIDLLQAESVIELIRGKTEAALALAQHQREGILSKRIAAVKEGIVTSLAFIEAYLDFPEEDIDIPALREIKTAVGTSLTLIEELLRGFQQGKVLREGVSVLIVGKPNVGKSSLLNTLLKEKRAIVTSVPGTTRDIIEEVVNIKGLPVNLLDTAGIRDSEDEIEQEGMKLTMEKIPLADLILFVVDSSKPFEDEDSLIVEAILGREFIVVSNKSDLPHAIRYPEQIESEKVVRISARDGGGIEELREAIFSRFIRGESLDGRDFTALSLARHRDALERAQKSLLLFLESFAAGLPLEIVSLELREALNALGEVTGETTPDDILDQIFSRFCIGK
ncbi:MAG: tRNA uridine-5-carboxymethylaminomethyl(34) synthesis GTPase MnmE [Deltaproteobacteria bacterium]|nr:tRNA uridine-5-carboxymethylaminomethyl(34) synthesis GTPase MnmE [Deltaproteobacteria bacterium]